MSEIYKGDTTKAFSFGVQGASVIKAEFIRNGTVVATVNNSDTVAIPYAITFRSGPFLLKWTYTVGGDAYTEDEVHHVVTPLFTKAELTAWDSDFSTLSDAKVKNLESLVRKIVQTYCNQKFESVSKTVVFKSIGNGNYSSPERIVSLPSNFRVFSNDVVYFNRSASPEDYYNVKIPIEAEAYELGWHAPRVPNTVTVTGIFGWNSVPDEVKTAALYLAESFTCKESLWRERYIKSVRAADWRFDYSEQTFASTGSLIADQLLDPFVKVGYAIV